MAQTNRVAPLILSSVDAMTISIITWTPFEVGGVPVDGLIEPIFMARITNRSSIDAFISFNGVDRHAFVLKWNSIKLYFQTNSSPGNYVSKVKKGTKFYVQGLPDPKGGDIYLSGYYNEPF